MRLSDERLDEILQRAQAERDASCASLHEWISIARELRQLRLRTSSQSRSALAPQPAAGSD